MATYCFIFIRFPLPDLRSRLLLDILHNKYIDIFYRVRDSDLAGQVRMFEVVVITRRRIENPTGFSERVDDFPAAFAVRHHSLPFRYLRIIRKYGVDINGLFVYQ